MKDLIERLQIDLNDASKETESFILNWTEAVIRRLWRYASESVTTQDYELSDLGLSALARLKSQGKLNLSQVIAMKELLK